MMVRWACLAAAAALAAGASAAEPPGFQARVEASREAARAFMGELKGELVRALREGGPVHAVTVCNTAAPRIAAAVTEETGWLEVGRTSLRVRNPANAPDPWERDVLRSFEARRERGEPVGELERAAFVEEGGRRVFRYMKAIPTGEPCLACHGEDLDPALAARIRALYPEDRATGFRLGEIRGAVTITQPAEGP